MAPVDDVAEGRTADCPTNGDHDRPPKESAAAAPGRWRHRCSEAAALCAGEITLDRCARFAGLYIEVGRQEGQHVSECEGGHCVHAGTHIEVGRQEGQ